MINKGKAAQLSCALEAWAVKPPTAENNGGKTGWPPGLLQDDCKGLSKWLSNRPDAKRRVREALDKMAEPAKQEPVAWAVFWGHRLERKHSVHFDRKTADAVASEIVSFQTEVRPLYEFPPQPKPLTVDCIGLALALEAQAKRFESQTAARAMRAAANGLRNIEATHGIKEQP